MTSAIMMRFSFLAILIFVFITVFLITRFARLLTRGVLLSRGIRQPIGSQRETSRWAKWGIAIGVWGAAMFILLSLGGVFSIRSSSQIFALPQHPQPVYETQLVIPSQTSQKVQLDSPSSQSAQRRTAQVLHRAEEQGYGHVVHESPVDDVWNRPMISGGTSSQSFLSGAVQATLDFFASAPWGNPFNPHADAEPMSFSRALIPRSYALDVIHLFIALLIASLWQAWSRNTP